MDVTNAPSTPLAFESSSAPLGEESPCQATKTRSTTVSSASPQSSPSRPRSEPPTGRKLPSQRRGSQRSTSFPLVHRGTNSSRRASGTTSTEAAECEDGETGSKDVAEGKVEQVSISTPSRPLKKANSEPAVPTYSPDSKPPKATKSPIEHPDKKLADAIRSVDIREHEKKDEGRNYVFKVKLRDEPGLGLVKVGCTKRDPSRRQSHIKSTCNIETTYEVLSIERPIRLYKKAESLIKADLTSWAYEFECECGQRHGEYFAITADMAWETTSRWKDFCEAEPWTKKGNLHPFWKDRLSNMYGAGSDNTRDWKRRSLRWTEFTRPTDWEVFQFNFVCFRRSMRAQMGRWAVFILAFFLSWVTYPSRVSFALLSSVSFTMMIKFTFDDTPFMANSVTSRSVTEKTPEWGTCETSARGNVSSDAGDEGKVVVSRETSILEREALSGILEEKEQADTGEASRRTVLEEQDDGEFKEVTVLD